MLTGFVAVHVFRAADYSQFKVTTMHSSYNKDEIDQVQLNDDGDCLILLKKGVLLTTGPVDILAIL